MFQAYTEDEELNTLLTNESKHAAETVAAYKTTVISQQEAGAPQREGATTNHYFMQHLIDSMDLSR